MPVLIGEMNAQRKEALLPILEGLQVSRNVPPDKVAEVVAGYKAQNPIKVEPKRNDDGTWDVTATFPD